jgi:hypothetical protein
MKKILIILFTVFFDFIFIQTEKNTKPKKNIFVSKIRPIIKKLAFNSKIYCKCANRFRLNTYSTKRLGKVGLYQLQKLILINGLIQTNYNKDGKIGDDSTITLHILNYVPNRMITLQAEISKNYNLWRGTKRFTYNVILFLKE